MAEFSCLGPSGSTNQQWLINGTQFEALNLTDVTVMFGDRTVLFSNTPLVFNGTTVQCILLAASGEELSSTVGVLLVQGNDSQLQYTLNVSQFLTLQGCWMLFLM